MENFDDNEMDEAVTPALVPAMQSTRRIRQARQLKKEEEEDEPKVKESRSLVSAMLGEAEDGDDLDGRRPKNLIPKDAEAVEIEVSGDRTNLVTPEEKEGRDTQKSKTYPEPLMTPALALVAPDVTPEAMTPIHPATVPTNPMDLLTQPGVGVQKQKPPTNQADIMSMFLQNAPKPEASMAVKAQESVNAPLPVGIPSPAIYVGLEGGNIQPSSVENIQPSAPPVQNDIKRVMEVMRQQVRR